MNINILEERVGSDSSHVKKEELHVVMNHEKATTTGVIESNQKECLAKSDDVLQDASEENNDNDDESNVIISGGGVKSKDGDPMPSWHEILQDATELESLIFCVRRPSARDKLFKFVDNLKKLSGKIKRYEDVTFKRNDKSTSIESFLKKRSIGDNDSSDDVSRAKKPRAISFPNTNNGVNSPNSNSSPVQGNDVEDLQSMIPQSLDPTIQVPLLKHRDKWVQHHKRRSHLHCPDFEASNKCPLGTKCDHWHIYTPKKPNLPIEKDGAKVKLIYTKEDVHRAYLMYRDATLSKNDYYEKIKNNELNFPNYCCAIKCPLDHTIYYAQPFPGDRNVKANKSSQGIWWYMTMKDAKEAVATQIIFDLKERGIVPNDFLPYGLISDAETGRMNAVNKASEMARLAIVVSDSRIKEQTLPDIIPWNYMETDCEKRCGHFNTPQQCAYGSKCRCAHVYYPFEVNNEEFPDREALVFAYKENFQIMLQDPFFLVGSNEFSMSSPFRVMTAVDGNGGMWYTAAMKCPYEGTIYYAAGGNTGKLNSQNIVLYPCAEDAKLAVAGIVLDSFKNRGLVGRRRISQQMNKIPKPPLQGKTSSVIAALPPHVTTCQQSHLMNQLDNSIDNLRFPVYSGMGSYVNQSGRGYDLGFQNKKSTSGTSHGGH